MFFKKESSKKNDICYMGVIKKEEDGEKLYFGPVKTTKNYSLTAKLNGEIVFEEGALIYDTPDYSWMSPKKIGEIKGKTTVKRDENTILLTGSEVINYFRNEDTLFEAIHYFDPTEPSKYDLKKFKKIQRAKKREYKRIERERKREERMREKELKIKYRAPLGQRIKDAYEELEISRHIKNIAKNMAKGTLGLAGYIPDIENDNDIDGVDFAEGILGSILTGAVVSGLTYGFTGNEDLASFIMMTWLPLWWFGQMGILYAAETAHEKYQKYKEHIEDLKKKAKINSSICENYVGGFRSKK